MMKYETCRWKTILGNACLPARYIFGIMSMFGIMVAYIMRACLSIAITQMVNQTKHEEDIINNVYCPSDDSVIHNENETKAASGDFNWDEETQGIILSAFYYGYILTHIPGGLLAQKFGGKYTFGFGVLCTAIFTLLTPLAAYYSVTALIVVRFLEGVGEGTTFPALCTLLAQWAPPHERSTLSTVTFTGVQIGTIVANLGGGIILQYLPGGWPVVFYIFGTVSVIWFVLWCFLCYNDPSSHPFISDKEKHYLQQTIGEIERKKDLKVPWFSILTSGPVLVLILAQFGHDWCLFNMISDLPKYLNDILHIKIKQDLGPLPWISILTSAPVWAIIIGEIGHDWALYTMVTDLPKYMSDVMKFSVAQNGLLSSLPYFATWVVSLLSSTSADWMLKNNYMSCTALRKSFATIGSIGPAIGVICASYVGCNKAAAAICFTAGMGLMGFCYGSIRVNSLDLSPNYSGTVMAFVNGFGCISGMVSPYVTGLLTPHRTLKEWRIVFWIMVIILVSSNIVFVIWGSGDVQPWNDPIQTLQNCDSNEADTQIKKSKNMVNPNSLHENNINKNLHAKVSHNNNTADGTSSSS